MVSQMRKNALIMDAMEHHNSLKLINFTKETTRDHPYLDGLFCLYKEKANQQD